MENLQPSPQTCRTVLAPQAFAPSLHQSFFSRKPFLIHLYSSRFPKRASLMSCLALLGWEPPISKCSPVVWDFKLIASILQEKGPSWESHSFQSCPSLPTSGAWTGFPGILLEKSHQEWAQACVPDTHLKKRTGSFLPPPPNSSMT